MRYEQDLHPRTHPRRPPAAGGLRRRLPRRLRTSTAPPAGPPSTSPGLIQEGERKSIEPLSRRVALPPELQVKDPEQALQQFVSQSPWDEQRVLKRYRAVMAETFASPEGIFVIDDTSFPKQGKHSVGVQRQYCGALGKKANCQVRPVSVHYVSPEGPLPAGDAPLPARELAERPGPARQGRGPRGRTPSTQTKGRIALELLDRVRAEGLPGGPVVADAGYGVSEDVPRRPGPARVALHRRGHRRDGRLHRGAAVGRPGRRHRRPPADAAPPGRGPAPAGRPQGPGGADAAAKSDVAGGDQGADVGPVRLAAASGRARAGHGACAGAEPLWLLIEEQADGKLKYAFSDLPADTSRLHAGGAAAEVGRRPAADRPGGGGLGVGRRRRGGEGQMPPAGRLEGRRQGGPRGAGPTPGDPAVAAQPQRPGHGPPCGP